MPSSRTYSHLEYGVDGENDYRGQYSNTRRATYPLCEPTQASRPSRAWEDPFSLSDHTLVEDYNDPLESRSWRSSSTADRQDAILPISRSMRRSERTKSRNTRSATLSSTDHDLFPTNIRRNSSSQTDMVYIDRLTIPANGPPLDTHLRNTKGNVHIKHLRIEDETADSTSRRPRRRRSRTKEKEKEPESISKLTRVCELACVVSLLLQFKEYREYKKEREKE
jgi:hypothetical protein